MQIVDSGVTKGQLFLYWHLGTCRGKYIKCCRVYDDKMIN